MQELAALLEGLERRGAADSAALGSMQSAVSRLQINLEALDKPAPKPNLKAPRRS